MLSPIVLFVYNRPEHTRRTVESLQKCELSSQSVLYVFSDGPKPDATDESGKRVLEVRNYLHKINGFRNVIIEESVCNKGLANSVIYGVDFVIKKYGKVIVLEDDLIVSPCFLRFMNEALDFYAKDKRIYSVGGYNYDFAFPKEYDKDVYIVHRAESWGWGTWENRWRNVDWKIEDANSFFASKKKQKRFNRGGNDMSEMLQSQLMGELDSWAIRWDYHLYKNNAFCLRPVKSLVQNIGFDGSGTHCGASEITSDVAFDNEYDIKLVKRIRPDRLVCRNFKNYFSGDVHVPLIKAIKRYIKHKFRILS